MHCRMQRQPLLVPLVSFTSNRIRSLRTLVFFSFFHSSMETTSFSPSIDSTDASSAAPGKEILRTSSASEAIGEGESAKEFGFGRSEFGRDSLVGTVQLYDRHVFLRHKSPEFWLPNVESAKSDRLPQLLAAALKARKGDMKKKTLLTICGATDISDSSEGDVLIFPDRIGYRRLTDADVDNFVELVLVKDTEWLPGAVETLSGSYIFVCAHGSRDQRCGVCGPILIEKFKEEIYLRGLEDQVFVSPCSHIGGHKYAGNVIIFSQSKTGEVSGNWYGYVSPDAIPMLLEQQIGKGEIIDHLWRGQMGLSVDEQKKAQSIRRQPNIAIVENRASGCCQGNGNLSCCQNATIMAKPDANHTTGGNDNENNPSSSSISNSKSVSQSENLISTWLKQPVRDTYAALAIVAAIASVAGAYLYYRN
ncbi:uncharacterized protein LOC110094554 [Dendrobium catenatum]|uniref:uncharacterized protein LOC110094554 n=1 Tax=Dendrobium catenatum TaxID=906689 RepID=UPI0009F254C7|nr:uncharacterized protein LOC110094554 [Dendrobium catenatum]